jgi:hypothetical protein
MRIVMTILLMAAVSLAFIGCKKSGTARAPSTTRQAPGGTAQQTQPPTTVGGGQQGATAGAQPGTTTGGQAGTTAGGQQGATAGGQAGTATGTQPGTTGEQPTTVSTSDRAKVQETGAKTGGTQK